MGKSKERNETEFLRGIIRQQKAELKHLKKQLARAEKGSRKQEALYAELTTVTDPASYAEPEAVTDDTVKCAKCHKPIKEIDLGTRVLLVCSYGPCKHRQTVAKITIKD